LQTSEEKYYNYGTNAYCDYVILPNSVELPMLETANIQQEGRPEGMVAIAFWI